MVNAKRELLEKIGNAKIICAKIEYKGTEITLSSFDDEAAYEEFIKKLDFKYDGGYGEQYLYGFVVLDNNTWLERSEYDGAEWWSLRVKPEMF